MSFFVTHIAFFGNVWSVLRGLQARDLLERRYEDGDEVTAVHHFELPMAGRSVQIQTQFLTASV
ncbi:MULTISPECIES: hypothetical protein [unclassified Nonomuraea]|uniref:hypothetical protein n=1 Tax=unclassified Nonomuraea TaxID=2593643 RepID=UPI0033E8985D